MNDWISWTTKIKQGKIKQIEIGEWMKEIIDEFDNQTINEIIIFQSQ